MPEGSQTGQLAKRLREKVKLGNKDEEGKGRKHKRWKIDRV